ncbi:MAG TPA: glycosyltransferase [Flavisolibacter sp.]
MEKKAIVHIIDTLATGGAEIQLKNSVNTLPEYRHLVVYLSGPAHFTNSFEGDVSFTCLDHKGWSSIMGTVDKLRRIITTLQPVLVHSHLFVSTIVARLATPRNFPLISTLHSMYSLDAFQRNRISLFLERLTLKPRHALIGVSDFVLKDYFRFIPFTGKRFVLYNFLPDNFFRATPHPARTGALKCVAVGNLKDAKNYFYLLDIFRLLKNTGVQLDIYGDGNLEQSLREQIEREDLPVILKGQVERPADFLPAYDLFIQASRHEGFGLSVIEAMALGIPTFLSDIQVFREITNNNSHFFPLDQPETAATLLGELDRDNEKRLQFVGPAVAWCTEQFNSRVYKSRLADIYSEISRS